jgi:hypothetical protein
MTIDIPDPQGFDTEAQRRRVRQIHPQLEQALGGFTVVIVNESIQHVSTTDHAFR